MGGNRRRGSIGVDGVVMCLRGSGGVGSILYTCFDIGDPLMSWFFLLFLLIFAVSVACVSGCVVGFWSHLFQMCVEVTAGVLMISVGGDGVRVLLCSRISLAFSLETQMGGVLGASISGSWSTLVKCASTLFDLKMVRMS